MQHGLINAVKAFRASFDDVARLLTFAGHDAAARKTLTRKTTKTTG